MIHVIVNPAGAGGKTMKTWLKAEEILHEKNAEYDVHFSSLKHNINDIVHELSETGEDTNLLLFGGDGTMNLAVNAIVDFEHTQIAFIPCGSGNDLAKALIIPANLNQCLDTVLKCETQRVLDVGEVVCHTLYDSEGKRISDEGTSRYFNISSGIGFDAEICAAVEGRGVKKRMNRIKLGKLSYIAEAVRVIFETKRTRCEILLDQNEKLTFDELLFTAAMNTAYEGGGFMFGPKADPSDGLLDLCAADHLSRFDFFRMFPYAYSGSHVKFDGVTMRRAKEADIRTGTPFYVHTDGEVLGLSDHITWRISDHKMRMMI